MKLHATTWGDGPRTAVLIHGLFADGGDWWQVAEALVERGYRVVAPDLRGHGRSARGSYTPALWASDLLESVPQRPDLMIGHSLGGLLLGLVAPALQPARALYVDPCWKLTAKQHEVLAPLWATQAEWSAVEVRKANPRWHERSIAARVRSLGLFDRACIRGLVPGGGHDYRPVGPAGDSVVIVADPSAFIPPDDAAALETSGFRIEIVPGAGHATHRDDFDGFIGVVDRLSGEG